LARTRVIGRQRRHERIRKTVGGTTERPRLSVFRSLNNIYAQVIDDTTGTTMVAASSLDTSMRALTQHKGNSKTAREVGLLIAGRAKEKGISKVVFDRSGYLYHGRVKALAEAAREAGLEF
jgi:large subunit ribosomal protein L18